MIASKDDRMRAAGWFVKAARASDDTRHDHESAAAGCGHDPDCERRTNDESWVAGRAAALAATNELAAIATASRDPVIYAMALRGCSLQLDAREGACTLVNAEQFAAIDPDNQAAWLAAASAAKARKDEAALSEALFRASKASRSDAYFGTATGLALASWPAQTSPMSKLLLSTQLVGIEASADIGSRSSLLSECSSKAVAEPARRQLCVDIAERMVGSGTTLLDVRLGVAIGERSGWPGERVAALKEQVNALLHATVLDLQAGDSQCETVRRSNEHVAEVGRLGEVDAARLAMQRSGKPQAALAAEFNRRFLAPGPASAPRAAVAASATVQNKP